MNRIKIDPDRVIGEIDRNIFGLFKENRPMYKENGIYNPSSKFADEDGFRSDVIEATRRLKCPIVRCIGGNTISGYRWMDGVGPKEERPARHDLAWDLVDKNQVGTNEYVKFCRKINAEPYFVVNCGDGDMREAADWVQYCNGTKDTTLVKLRKKHGYEEPHKIKYWGIGNEVETRGQIGKKTPEEYARAYTEFAKVMRWSDPSIKFIAAFVCSWRNNNFTERARLLIEQAADFIDYMAIHWYAGNPGGLGIMPGTREKPIAGFESLMAISEAFDERIEATEGVIKACKLEYGINRPILIALDEWAIRHQYEKDVDSPQRVQEAIASAMNFNSVIRHADTVKMANHSGLSRRLVLPGPDGLLIQSSFYTFELYSAKCGTLSLDVFWDGDTFSGWDRTGLRTLDVTATLNPSTKELSLFVVNRSRDKAEETAISLNDAEFNGDLSVKVLNGASIDSANTFEKPNEVGVKDSTLTAKGKSVNYSFEPHSLTVISGKLGK